VSQKTVSFFLKGEGGVAEETRRKLEALCKQHKYFPNCAARSIRSKRFNRIAFAFNPVMYYNSYIAGSAVELERLGFSLSLVPFASDPDTMSLVSKSDFFTTLSVDGVMGVAGSYIPPEIDSVCEEMGVPAVWLNRRSNDPSIRCVGIDEGPAIDDLADYLLAAGRKRIAWFGGRSRAAAATQHYHHTLFDREARLEKALELRGAKLFAKMSATCDLIDAARALLSAKELPDAVVCYNFHFHNCAANAAWELGIAPSRLSLATFTSDWERQSNLFPPRIQVQIPEAELAVAGSRYLCELIAGNKRCEPPEPVKARFHSDFGNIETAGA
jgi:DNA-binding LacI/PurR family transcriptional regulator